MNKKTWRFDGIRNVLTIGFISAALCLCIFTGCSGGGSEDGDEVGATGGAASSSDQVRVAFVTNNASNFWQIAKRGCEKAEKDFNCKVEFKIPPNGTAADQQTILENLLVMGVSGVAISPVDPANQVAVLNRAAKQVNLICHDSDSPDSDRLCYVGTNNVKAGEEAGRLIKEVLPNGGKIMLYVGTLDAQNAQERYQGIKNVLAGTNIEIVDVRTDLTDRARSKSNVEDALVTNPDVKCHVGLWSYNGPSILSAVMASGKSVAQGGDVNIVCFDEEDEALQGIADGAIYGTVVQKPFEFGYQSVRILAGLARGDQSALPEGEHLDTGVVVVNKDNVDEFRTKLAELLNG